MKKNGIILMQVWRKTKLSIGALSLVLLANFKGFAQQDALFSQYMFNQLAINPAYAGHRDVLSMTGVYRSQWMGIDGAPTTQSFTIDTPIKNERIGLGLSLMNDEIGQAFKTTSAFLTWSYRLRVSPKTTLSFGMQGGAENVRWDFSKLAYSNVVGSTDPTQANTFSKILPNVGAGLYLSNDRAYFGISAPTLIQHNMSIAQADSSSKLYRHYFASTGFVIGLGSALKLKPSLLLRYVQGAPLSVDVNANLWIRDKVALGASYRFSQINSAKQKLGDSMIGMLELQLTPQFRLGYSHDFLLNKLNKTGNFIGNPSNEILMRYEFGYGRNKILSPRYF